MYIIMDIATAQCCFCNQSIRESNYDPVDMKIIINNEMKIDQENQIIDFRLITQRGKNHAFIPLCQ